MVSLTILFWMFVIVFAIIGAMRGWAKEILVTFTIIVSIFVLTVFEKFAPGLQKSLTKDAAASIFWLRFAVTVGLVIFGYQSVSLPRISESPRLIRGNLQDTLLGLFIGILNGFLLMGTLWYYLHIAKYPLPFILAPEAGTPLGDAALKMIPYLAPAWLGTPAVYFATAIAFGLVIVLFL